MFGWLILALASSSTQTNSLWPLGRYYSKRSVSFLLQNKVGSVAYVQTRAPYAAVRIICGCMHLHECSRCAVHDYAYKLCNLHLYILSLHLPNGLRMMNMSIYKVYENCNVYMCTIVPPLRYINCGLVSYTLCLGPTDSQPTVLTLQPAQPHL